MAKIDLKIHKDRLERVVQRARERKIVIPTFAQMKNPELVPASIKEQLATTGLWDVAPQNLFRITWHNEPKAKWWWFRRREFHGIALQPDRHQSPHHRAGRQVVPDRRPQGRCRLRLPRAAPGDRAIRSDPARRPSGLRPAISAAVAPTTQPCWAAPRSPSCPKA